MQPKKLSKKPLKLLCIADLHHYTLAEIEKIQGVEYDMCVLLGDISGQGLTDIKRIIGENRVCGVLGNHDEYELLEKHGIFDVNGCVRNIGDYGILGFGGSHRYKNGDYPMLTQAESLEQSRGLAKMKYDIVVSHDSMYKLFSKDDKAHIGLKGLTKLVKKSKLKLNICGHFHRQTQIKKHGCTVICVYRCAIISLPELTAERIF